MAGISAIASLPLLLKMPAWLRFAKQLQRDLNDNVITAGKLWSGLPWLVDGAPAPWRLARPVIGRWDFDIEKLKKL